MAEVLANSMACHPRATYHIAGCCHLVNSLSRFQSHMPHCRVQSPGEITIMIVPHCWVKNSIRHIENRLSPYFFLFYFFCFLNAVQALISSGFRIVSDTLVNSTTSTFRFPDNSNGNFSFLKSFSFYILLICQALFLFCFSSLRTYS